MGYKELLRDLIIIGILLLLVILLRDFIISNSRVISISLLFFAINYILVAFKDIKKYDGKNFPYKPYKSKRKINERMLLGILAGFHYLFFIGTYNHKKYNTQVRYPETLECIFGNISQIMIFIIYVLISVNLFKIIGYYSLIFMVVPIITNIISIKKIKRGK